MYWSCRKAGTGPTLWQLTGPIWAVGRRSHDFRGDDLLIGGQKSGAVASGRKARRASDSQLLDEPLRFRKASEHHVFELLPKTAEAVDVDDGSEPKSLVQSANEAGSRNMQRVEDGVRKDSVESAQPRKIDEAIPEEAPAATVSDEALSEQSFFKRQPALRHRDHRRTGPTDKVANGHLVTTGVHKDQEASKRYSMPENLLQSYTSYNHLMDVRVRSTPTGTRRVTTPERPFQRSPKKTSADRKVSAISKEQDTRKGLLNSYRHIGFDSNEVTPSVAAVSGPAQGRRLPPENVDRDATVFETETVHERFTAEHEVDGDSSGYRQINLGSGPPPPLPNAPVPVEVVRVSPKQHAQEVAGVPLLHARQVDVVQASKVKVTPAELRKLTQQPRKLFINSVDVPDGSVDSVIRSESNTSQSISDPSVPSSPVMCEGERHATRLINKSKHVVSQLRAAAWRRTHSPEYIGDTSSGSQSPLLISSQSPSRRGSESPLFLEQEYTSKTSIHSLNDELLLHILSRLPTRALCRAGLVCRKWQRLHLFPGIWSRIEIRDYKRTDIDSVVEFLLRRLVSTSPYACLSVKSVMLDRCTSLSDAGLFAIARRCPELVALQIPFSESTTGVGLASILTNCPNLTFVDASSCPGLASLSCKSESGLSFAENASFLDLRYLDLSDCAALGDLMLSSLLQCCTFLEFLYLRRCDNITDNGIESVAAHCRSLKEISLNDCYRVGDRAVKCLSKCCSDLKYVSVAKCAITDESVECVAKHLKNLKYLNVHNCDGVSDSGIIQIAANCKRLRSLDVGKCRQVTNVSLHALSRNDALKRLSVKDCPRVDDAGLRKLATYSKKLKHLNIQGCNFNFETYVYLRQRCRMCIIEHNEIEFG